MCNQEIKFGLFFKRAMELGADFVATGHYVRLQKVKSHKLKVPSYELYSAKDKDKTQEYFLWTLTQKQLKKCLFPLGDYDKKTQVRAKAKKFKLPNAEKKDSQGVCFLGNIHLSDFLSDFIDEKKGKVLDTSGKVLGSHSGAHQFTIGQRRGLKIGGFDKPKYVAEKNIKTNTVVLADENDPALLSSEVDLINVNFINPSLFQCSQEHWNKEDCSEQDHKVLVRLRYRQPLFKATLIINSKNPQKARLLFAQPQKFVAPGQSAVFYNTKEKMLGGGIIKKKK
jgi:tRNA-specific 2-thiouridylase